ncbi:Coenzyme F420-reducing hydrogenase, alpha subunit [Methanocaldococcus lauensis]|uniref:Coenzyme F420-reducing hydrogenase, alpha subunit n=1 Tax=Methanocaldococcus lauensis TaxID=2546128 RepID=A0A8D6PUG8_9EURY|nr:nickel-dependent hydrogenase large subunit [Methanocaldococcus lauensis]CAB3287488.1 Coenzyme F420-reducing hydrogenase, alpha subunit [Methanocaldococcus lauensis]
MKIRGFETSMMGRDIDFIVPSMTRLCYLNEISHALAGVTAVEKAYNITVPNEGQYLRDIARLGEIIEVDAIKLSEFINTKKLEDIGNEIKSILGKKGKYLAVGGVLQNISDKRKEKLLKLANEGLNLVDKEFINLVEERKKKISLPDVELIDAYNFDINKVETNGYPKIALYDGKVVYSGALSRMYNKGLIKSKNLWDVLSARVIEIEHSLMEIKNLLNKLKLTYPYMEPIIKDGKAIGEAVIEGGEGIVYHRVELIGREILDYTILTSENFNKAVLDSVDNDEGKRIIQLCERCYYL